MLMKAMRSFTNKEARGKLIYQKDGAIRCLKNRHFTGHSLRKVFVAAMKAAWHSFRSYKTSNHLLFDSLSLCVFPPHSHHPPRVFPEGLRNR